jgi:hypothetical protein
VHELIPFGDCRIDSCRELVAGVVAFSAGSAQSDLGKFPERQPSLAAVESVSEAPKARTVRLDQQEEPIAVVNLVGLRAWAERLNLPEGQHGRYQVSVDGRPMLRAYARASNNAASWHLYGAIKSFNFNKLDGAAYRTRTCDPIITNDVLYQLS